MSNGKLTLKLVAAAAITLVALPATANASRNLYFPEGPGDNLLAQDVNVATGVLSPTTGFPVAATDQPQGLIVSPNGKNLFVGLNVLAGNDQVAAFGVSATGGLTPVTGSPFNTSIGANPFGIAVTADGARVYVVNNGSDEVDGFTIAADGALTEIPGLPLATGGTDPTGIAVTPGGGTVYASVTGTDKLRIFSVGANGTLSTLGGLVDAGDQPRGMTVTPDGRRLYVAQGGAVGSIAGFDIADNGSLTPITGSPFPTGGNNPIVAAVSPNGRHVFATHDNSTTVASFDVGATGALTPVTGSPFAGGGGGSTTLVVTPDSRHLYTVDSPAATISGLRIAANGALSAITGSPFPSATTATDLFNLAISPDQGPTAAFTSTPAQPGQQTAFNGSGSTDSDGTVARFDWDFGDGQTATTTTPTADHIYAAPGTYQAKLTVTDNEGCSTAVVYTGQTAACNGSAAASITQPVTIVDTPTDVALSGKKTQKLGKTVSVGVSCSEACTAAGSGSIVIPAGKKGGKSERKSRTFKLGKASKSIGAGAKSTLKLKIPKKGQKAAAKAIKGGATVKAKITVKATDAGGNVTQAKRTVKLTD